MYAQTASFSSLTGLNRITNLHGYPISRVRTDLRGLVDGCSPLTPLYNLPAPRDYVRPQRGPHDHLLHAQKTLFSYCEQTDMFVTLCAYRTSLHVCTSDNFMTFKTFLIQLK